MVFALAADRPYRMIASVKEIERLDKTWNISSTAAEMLEQWPHAMIEALSRRRARCDESEKGSLFKVFGDIYRGIYVCLKAPQYEFLRVAFTSYIAERWTGAYARRNSRTIGCLPYKSAWIPAAFAAKSLAVSRRSVCQLVADGALAGEVRVTAKGRRFVVVNRKVLEREAGRLRPGLTLEEAARRLGLRQLRFAGLLPYICPEAIRPAAVGCRWSVPRSWIDSWEAFIVALPLERRNKEVKERSLDFALRHLFPDDEQVAVFLGALLAGDVHSVRRDCNFARLGNLKFEEGELRRWARSTDTGTGALISLREAADRLEVKQEVAYSLARSGLLKTQFVRVGRRTEIRTTTGRLKEFGATYAFGRDVAKRYGKSPKAMAALLRDSGVPAVCGPGVDSCRQLVYERARLIQLIAGADLHEPAGYCRPVPNSAV